MTTLMLDDLSFAFGRIACESYELSEEQRQAFIAGYVEGFSAASIRGENGAKKRYESSESLCEVQEMQ